MTFPLDHSSSSLGPRASRPQRARQGAKFSLCARLQTFCARSALTAGGGAAVPVKSSSGMAQVATKGFHFSLALFALSWLLLSTALNAGAKNLLLPEPAKRVIDVDYSKIKGPHNQFFREVVGAGRAAEGLRADWQRDLALVRRECGFKYIRFHGLLQDELGVYSEDRQGR